VPSLEDVWNNYSDDAYQGVAEELAGAHPIPSGRRGEAVLRLMRHLVGALSAAMPLLGEARSPRRERQHQRVREQPEEEKTENTTEDDGGDENSWEDETEHTQALDGAPRTKTMAATEVSEDGAGGGGESENELICEE